MPLLTDAISDNAKLVTEVNRLHGELIQRKDAADSQVSALHHFHSGNASVVEEG